LELLAFENRVSIGERETIALGEPMIFANKVEAGSRKETRQNKQLNPGLETGFRRAGRR
jgi:hypothetical protein